ncbi:hypothetical protein KIH27_02615 [Mycobacterium sp. M1]|uniref:Transmembrane protein n=1 Tax=Mycolicibacter acidiphilus TaxID=2835306 RepID=A0ABS5RG81_9MYCO|nr:hypothetical protein [Mycolicibacter acidiphilus]MBS9532476.1 hypothetical protein [Mycolicibacter acidiphilus]
MSSRFLPYATTPARLLAQLLSDALIAAWTAGWVLVGLLVHRAVAVFATVGEQVESGAHGVASNLQSAGGSADRIPLVGDALSKPLTGASAAALEIAGAGQTLHATAGWLAVLLGLAVATAPIAIVGAPWLMLRLRFFRRKRAALELAATPGGEQLLALRALTGRPLGKLIAVSPDPAGAWRRADHRVIHGLAALELRSAGLARRHHPAHLSG